MESFPIKKCMGLDCGEKKDDAFSKIESNKEE
jgi:hypothetical protein